MIEGFKLFRDEATLFEDDFPDFKYSESGQGVPELNGTLSLTDNQGMLIYAYQIRIVCSTDYPLSFPVVYEMGGRIPINMDWHVYSDGHACICSKPEEIIICHNGITLKSFIEQQVKPYFFNQKYREMHGFFLKERSHGSKGIIEFFQEVFKTNDLLLIARILYYIKSNVEPNRVHNCFCGSGVKYRRCHREVFRLFKPLPIKVLDSFIQFLRPHQFLV